MKQSAKKKSDSQRCVYDWQDSSRDLLACAVHDHTIMRMSSLGHDVLLDLLREKRLSGKALADAEALAVLRNP